MKTSGKLAIIFAVIFVAFAVAGGLLIAKGGIEVISENEKLAQFLEDASVYVSDLEFSNHDYEKIDFAYSYKPDGELETIKIEDLKAYDIEFKYADTESVIFDFSGKYPTDYIEDYNIIHSGTFEVDDASDDLPVNFDYSGRELTISLEQPVNISGSVKGTVTITLPNDKLYNITLDGIISNQDIEHVQAARFKIVSCIGIISVEGNIKSFNIDSCIGNVDLSTDSRLTEKSIVTSNTGNTDIELADSRVTIEKSGNIGRVRLNDINSAGGVTIEITDNTGNVTVEADD